MALGLPWHHEKKTDAQQQQPLVFHTAGADKKMKMPVLSQTGLKTHDWNPLSKHKLYLRHLAKVSQAGGYSNINVPFQNGIWSKTTSPVKKVTNSKPVQELSKANPLNWFEQDPGPKTTRMKKAKMVAAHPHKLFHWF